MSLDEPRHSSGRLQSGGIWGRGGTTGLAEKLQIRLVNGPGATLRLPWAPPWAPPLGPSLSVPLGPCWAPPGAS